MKNKNAIIGIVVAVIVAAVVACVFIFSNNNNTSTTTGSNENQGNGNSIVSKNKDVEAVDNNDNYYISVKGKKFKVGDKISNLKTIGLKQQDKVLSEKIRKHSVIDGADVIENEAGNKMFLLAPYNPTDSTITVADAVIGACNVGGSSYSKISKEVLDLDIEVGGIKLGDSPENIEKIFGDTKETKFETFGFTSYKYKSKVSSRIIEFTVDDTVGKVSGIFWKNLDYND